MPYTLTKGLLWFLIALVIGFLMGWLLRSIAATRQLRAARAGHPHPSELAPREAGAAQAVAVPAEPATAAAGEDDGGPPPTAPADDDPAPDTAGEMLSASEVLGRPVEPDDLTVIVGIDADIAVLCHGIGVDTWAELAGTEVSLLRTMLDDAGPTVSPHRPDTWPAQAGLLAGGRWAEFKELADQLAEGDPAT